MSRSQPYEIWEWRAFGQIDEKFIAKVESFPIRLGIENQRQQDIYLISPGSNQNLKLRLTEVGWALKFKLFLGAGPSRVERYREGEHLVFSFPLSPAVLRRAASLLGIRLPDSAPVDRPMKEDEFLRVMAASSPPISAVPVSKIRSQYQFSRGWLELAEVVFPCRSVRSFSIISPDLELVEYGLRFFDPPGQLEVINYIEACRRWG
jgi:hypothetical protein